MRISHLDPQTQDLLLSEERARREDTKTQEYEEEIQCLREKLEAQEQILNTIKYLIG